MKMQNNTTTKPINQNKMTIESIMWQVEPRKTLDSEIIRSKIKEALLIQEEYYEKLLDEQKKELAHVKEQLVNLIMECKLKPWESKLKQ